MPARKITGIDPIIYIERGHTVVCEPIQITAAPIAYVESKPIVAVLRRRQLSRNMHFHLEPPQYGSKRGEYFSDDYLLGRILMDCESTEAALIGTELFTTSRI
jgi:hypothetical protein